MIRKEGKARWVYRCTACGVDKVSVDQFRAIEARNAHQRTLSHVCGVFGEAAQPIMDAYAEVARSFSAVADSLQSIYATPPNLPHDPAILRDRRKWGGR